MVVHDDGVGGGRVQGLARRIKGRLFDRSRCRLPFAERGGEGIERRLGRLQQGQRQRQRRGDAHQRVFVVVTEVLVLVALDQQHADDAAQQPQRHHQLAARLGQAGQGDLFGLAVAQAHVLRALADGARVGLPLGQVADAQGHALARGNAGQALTDRDLGAHARGLVAQAGDGVEAVATRVAQQDHAVVDLQVRLQGAQGLVEQLVHVGAGADALDDRARAPGDVAARLRRHQRAPAGDLAHRAHLVDVGAQQPVDLVHAGVRGDACQLGAHALEHRAAALGAHVAQLHADAGGGVGVVHGDHAAARGQDVLAAAVEELEGQGHVAFVDVLDLRQEAQVRHAFGRDRAHHGRDHAFEHAAHGPERDGLVLRDRCAHGLGCGGAHRAGSSCSGMAWPAPGPGVWFQAPVGVKVTTRHCSGGTSSQASAKVSS